jgi:hypothetical protein
MTPRCLRVTSIYQLLIKFHHAIPHVMFVGTKIMDAIDHSRDNATNETGRMAGVWRNI